jgi:hypothetical protein
VRYIFQFLTHSDLDSQFLSYFPPQALFESFSDLTLASRKFPQTTQMIV